MPSRTRRSTGKCCQVRLNPTVDSNVVTYTTIIDAPNARLKLKPGMTATLSIVVARHNDVLRVPAAALKFKPAADVLARYGARGTTLPAGKGNTVWISNGTTIAPVAVTIGLSDGVQTEIVSPSFGDGTPVVTRMTTSS